MYKAKVEFIMKRKDVENLTWRELVDGQAPELEMFFPETMFYFNAGEEEWSSHFFKKERSEILKQLVF